MSLLEWLSDWYQAECNGDWEHNYGIVIETLDNSGWTVRVDLRDTEYETLELPRQFVENSESDWHSIEFKDAVFIASGDASKLEFLLEQFKGSVEIFFKLQLMDLKNSQNEIPNHHR